MAHTLLKPQHPHMVEFVLPDRSADVYAVPGPGRRFMLTMEPPEELPREGTADVLEVLLGDGNDLWRYSAVFPHVYWAPYRLEHGEAVTRKLQSDAVYDVADRHDLDVASIRPPAPTPDIFHRRQVPDREFPVFEQYYYPHDLHHWEVGIAHCPLSESTIHYPLRITQSV